MRTLLVPTDFSDTSQTALSMAVLIANQANARIHLLSVFHLPPLPADVATIPEDADYEQLRKDTESALESMVAEISDRCIHDPVFEAVRGLAADEILAVASEKQLWLTVMGTKGTTGLERVVFGSVAAEVAQKITSPLLLVPEETHVRIPGPVLFATDFHASDKEAMEHVMMWTMDPQDLTVTFLHVSDGRVPVQFEKVHLENFQDQMRSLHDAPDMRFELEAEPDAAEAIIKASDAGDFDLIVLAPVRRNWLMRLLMPSVTQQLIHHSTRPMLVFPAKDND